MKPERAGKKWRDPTLCELRPDVWQRRYTDHKRCVGTVMKFHGLKLCLRHRKLVTAILEDAIREGTVGESSRHPRWRSKRAAA